MQDIVERHGSLLSLLTSPQVAEVKDGNVEGEVGGSHAEVEQEVESAHASGEAASTGGDDQV